MTIAIDSDGEVSGIDARDQLYTLMRTGDGSDTAIREALQLGTQYLDVDHGYLTTVDEDDAELTVVNSTYPQDGRFPTGSVEKLETTYCRRTIEGPEPLAIHDAGNQGWADDDAYQTHGLDTYVGVPVTMFDDLFGTLCFVSSDPRNQPFTSEERIFVEIAGQTVSRILERNHREAEIQSQMKVSNVLNRVLRHNLRNDLNVITGYVERLETHLESSETEILDRIDTSTSSLLKLADQARTLDSLTQPAPVARPKNVVPLVRTAVERKRSEYPTVEIHARLPEQAIGLVAPEFEDAVAEIIDNAARFAQPEAEIEVSVRTRSETVETHIADNGPGLPEEERNILVEGEETALDHGSGLGLFLVHWLIQHLDGAIAVSSGEDGTKISLRIPTVLSDAATEVPNKH